MKEKNLTILDINTVFHLNEYEIYETSQKLCNMICKLGLCKGFSRNVSIESINKLDKDNMIIVADDIDNIYNIFEENKEYIIDYMFDIVKYQIIQFKKEFKK
jgi:hypothetical protein